MWCFYNARRRNWRPIIVEISRIEDADYDRHSVETLRRIATALHAKLRIEFEPDVAGEHLDLRSA